MNFIVLLERSHILEFLSSVDSELFSSKNVWLVKTEDTRLGNLYFPIDSKVFTFSEDDGGIDIEEVYNVYIGMERVVKQLGSWRYEEQLILDPLPLFERRKDFFGYKFQAETVNEPPYAVANMENLMSGKDTHIGGIWGEIWHGTLEKTLNFTSMILPSPDANF